jgi:hypothetical protein
MKKIGILFLFFIFLQGCRSKEMSLEDLRKAKWDSLSPGVYHISKSNERTVKVDSILIKIMGTTSIGFDARGMSPDQLLAFGTALGFIQSSAKEYVPDNDEGYLKLNFGEMLGSKPTIVAVYLRGDYSTPFSFASDSTVLLNILGIKKISFVSKEEAGRKYFDENGGDTSWSQVLDANPLPNSIEIELEDKHWTETSLKELENAIMNKIAMASVVSYPKPFTNSGEYLFLEYKRVGQ